MKKLSLTLIVMMGLVQIGFGQEEAKTDEQSLKVKEQNAKSSTKSYSSSAQYSTRSRSQWWDHWNGIGCSGKGLYCIRRLITDNMIESNVTDGLTTIKLEKNNITISTIGKQSTISKEVLENFINKKVEITPNGIPDDLVEELFSSVGLKTPKKGIIFKISEQSYEVRNTVFKNKPVLLIETMQKTQISIDGKVYNLSMSNKSGESDEK